MELAMKNSLKKLLLVALIASFYGQAQATAVPTRRIERPRTKEESMLDIFMMFAGYHVPEIEKLIAAGADVNAENRDGVTPLHWAASQRYHLGVKALIAASANVNTQSDAGSTPLHWALDRLEIVLELITAGADVNIRDNSGNTPLHLAAIRRDHYYVVEALIKAGADVNAQNLAGDTPLHCAINSIKLVGNVEISDQELVRILVRSAGANKDLTNARGNTASAIALHEINTQLNAHLRGKYQNIHVLLTDPTFCSHMSPEIELCRAISSNNPAILKEALDRLAYPINCPIDHSINASGETLLHYASMRCFVGQALLLLSYGANPRQTNSAGVEAIAMGSGAFRRALATATERSHLSLSVLERPSSEHASVLPRAITEQIFAFAGDLNPLPETLIAGISGLEIDNVMALRPGTHIAAVLDAHKRAAAKSERRAQAEERAEAADRRQRRRLADGSAEASPRHADGCTGANGCPGCGHE